MEEAIKQIRRNLFNLRHFDYTDEEKQAMEEQNRIIQKKFKIPKARIIKVQRAIDKGL